MYNRGEKIFYGQTGVCTVEDISEKEFKKGEPQLYYTLRPLYRSNNIIYAPVENAKVYMRRLISSDEAKQACCGDKRNMRQSTDRTHRRGGFQGLS